MRTLLTVILFVFLLGGCRTEKKVSFTDFIEIDVTKKYPVKELFLEDLADIEFRLPVMHDDYLYNSIRYVTNKYVIGYESSGGDIVVFDKQGQPLHKFNKKGEGPSEYLSVFGIIYDPLTDELFVSSRPKIQVYSLTGDYKRTLSLEEGKFIPDLVLFDDKTFLCYDNYEFYPAPFFLISREDGSLIEEIDIRYSEKLNMNARKVGDDGLIYTYSYPKSHIVRTKNGFLLTEHSIDSVYLYTPDKQLTPVLRRTPAIASMTPFVYLNSYLESPSYLFMNTVSTEFDWDTKKGFTHTHLVLDKSDGRIYEQKIYLKEYQGKEFFLTSTMQDRVTDDINVLISLGAAELQDALEEGKLSGSLKEIVSQMEEDANNLLLLLRFK